MIFIDQLSLRTTVSLFKLALRGAGIINCKNVQVLDKVENRWALWLLRKVIKVWGINISEADFFLGHLQTKDQRNLHAKAFHAGSDLAFKLALDNIKNTKALSELNEEWGRNTILLYLTRYFHNHLGLNKNRTVAKILIAEALCRDNEDEEHHLILFLPTGISAHVVEGIKDNINLHLYKGWGLSVNKTRISIFLLFFYISLMRLIWRIAAAFKPSQSLGDETKPALLVLQEDHLSLDRSYRNQPHWLFDQRKQPKFRTLVLLGDSKRFTEPNIEKLSKQRIYGISRNMLYGLSGKHAIQKKINRALRILTCLSVFKPKEASLLSFQLAMLFLKASLLATLCKNKNVTAFMTCENYYVDADAMNLIARHMNIHTFSYQYSNMSKMNSTMMTTADTLFTFSDQFHGRWRKNGIGPKAFVNIGYVFDSSFSLMSDRAEALRSRLNDSGSKFNICFFDENVSYSGVKFGRQNIKDHFLEMSGLATYALRNPSVAILIKSQFIWNSPNVIFKGNKIIESALDTGRFVVLSHGNFRNSMFPAEAALASDIAIGHSVGGTAALETALAGSRCILLDRHGELYGPNLDIYRKGHILFNGLESALRAISAYREGRPEYKDLGDWSSFIHLFDPFRDGNSASRLRLFLEDKTLA